MEYDCEPKNYNHRQLQDALFVCNHLAWLNEHHPLDAILTSSPYRNNDIGFMGEVAQDVIGVKRLAQIRREVEKEREE